MRKFLSFIILCFCMFTFTFAHAADEVKPPEEYVTFIRKLKKEMVKRGISQKTVDKVYEKNYYHPEPLAVKMDRKQAEFVLTTTDYLNRVLNQKRVETAQKKYKELYPLFKDLEKKYGVQFEYLVAFWGIETNFGSTFGNFEVIDALTTLAYDKRRRNFFKEELYQALKIIDTYDIDFEKMEGSWAGAMGHFQFMPSTFNAYAVDYDGDDKIDIWHSFEDAVASAANYLSKMGWNANEAWGAEVSLPWNFDYSQAARTKLKTVEEWGKLGVRTTNGKALSFNKRTKAAIILPEGSRGRAYIVLPNFSKIMKWNRSENYALAVSKLADYAKSGSKFKAFTPSSNPKLKTEDISNLQSFINKVGIAKIDEDGQLGSKTKEAVRKLQKEVKMPQDGYPDYRLLQKINNYNPDIGFVVPVQPQKAKKDSSKK